MRTAISGACSGETLLQIGDLLVVRGEGRTARYTRRFFLGSVGLFGLDPLKERATWAAWGLPVVEHLFWPGYFVIGRLPGLAVAIPVWAERGSLLVHVG